MGYPLMDGLSLKIPSKSVDENWGYPYFYGPCIQPGDDFHFETPRRGSAQVSTWPLANFQREKEEPVSEVPSLPAWFPGVHDYQKNVKAMSGNLWGCLRKINISNMI